MAARAGNESTRERILDAALPLFAAVGPAGAPPRRIAKAADVNVATLAYHFDGKEGLYLTVLQKLHEDLAEAFPETLPSAAPTDVLDFLVTEAWAFARQHRQHIRLLIRHVLDHRQHAEVVAESHIRPLMTRAEALVGVFRPELSSARRRMIVLGVMHTVARLAIEGEDDLRLMLGDPDDVDVEVRGFLRDLIAGQLGLR